MTIMFGGKKRGPAAMISAGTRRLWDRGKRAEGYNGKTMGKLYPEGVRVERNNMKEMVRLRGREGEGERLRECV